MQVALVAGQRAGRDEPAISGSTAGVSPTARATNGADSGARATDTGLRSPPTEATRPADSGMPTPDLASTWNPWAPSSQATVASPVRSVVRASRGGSWRVNRSSAAARPERGMMRVSTSPWRSTQASTTIMPLGVSRAP